VIERSRALSEGHTHELRGCDLQAIVADVEPREVGKKREGWGYFVPAKDSKKDEDEREDDTAIRKELRDSGDEHAQAHRPDAQRSEVGEASDRWRQRNHSVSADVEVSEGGEQRQRAKG
jgi:hypothetical protein